MHEYEHAHSRVPTLGSGSPRPHRRARGKGARGIRRARRPSGRARDTALALLVRGRRLQPDRGGSSLPKVSRDPRPPRLGRDVPDLRPTAEAAPHAREPRGGPGPGLWQKAARDRGPGRGAGTATGCPHLHPQAPHFRTATAACHHLRRRTITADRRSAAGSSRASSDRPDHVAGALSRAVHDRQGGPRQTSASPAPPPPRDPGRRPGRDLRPRAHPAPREGREGEARADGQAAATPTYPSRDGYGRPETGFGLAPRAAGGQGCGVPAGRRPVRLRFAGRKEMHGARFPGVPPCAAVRERGTGDGREHLPSLPAPQPIRGRAGLRASRCVGGQGGVRLSVGRASCESQCFDRLV